MEKDIAIVVLNYVQYINVIPGIKQLIDNGYSVDFYCPKVDTEDGFKEMFDDIREFLIKEKFNVYDSTQNIRYKVVLEPYPQNNIIFQTKYKIKTLSCKILIFYL